MNVDVVANLATVRAQIDAAVARAGRRSGEVQLLAVSKTHPAAAVRSAFAAGQRAFGENRVQELAAKAAELRDLDSVQWHLIGSLQTNKVRELLAVPGLALVHSLDRPRLADELQRELAPTGRRLAVLLQANVTGEASKHGCPPGELPALLAHVQQRAPALVVEGLMAMGPLEGDPVQAFALASRLRDELRAASGLSLPTLSLGMSGDLDAAVAAGSTLVRIGTAVFGRRD
ncbi:MAG: YggS family pyridoxal phosphate-dependent enzyme [Planctomycetota bacterium]